MKIQFHSIPVALTAGAMAAALLLTGCGGSSASSAASDSAAASASTAEAAAEASSALFDSLTSEDLEKLVSGELTLADLEQKQTEATQTPASEAAASSDSAPSASSPSSSEKPADTAATDHPAYEDELKALLQQLYAVKARAESGLNSCIASAKAEYKALPKEKQTTTRKITIVLGKTSELEKLQSSCDKEVDSIVSQMRTLLVENGQSTELADQAQASYEAQKKERIATLKSELYK